MSSVEPFRAPDISFRSNNWFFAGLTSSFPELGLKLSVSISKPRIKLTDPGLSSDIITELDAIPIPPCKIFQTSTTHAAELTTEQALGSIGLEPQVLVFQHHGKFHAIDHQCPHRSYPLSRGSIHDIEDFGIVLSAGITCPKHGWMFDLHTGESDRGSYKLGVWEVDLRPRRFDTDGSEGDDQADVSELDDVKEVWIRKKQKRIG